MVSRPLTFDGAELALDLATSAAGSVRVELRDEREAPIPGFTLDDCDSMAGDDLERVVTWGGGSDVRSLAGRPVRLRFAPKDADVYSLRFRKATR